ncbi:unnamed protein product [Allacma fusca]|uniref:C-type lectin domain-containing protein n=1 Tax=Allacma fusca TaxID=39272 RepID=A0A8J2LX44_9HEXA|nr:unnamed protein product [Allacma fusca]
MRVFAGIFIALCAVVTIVHSLKQVQIAKVGKKTFYILESSEPMVWGDAVKACEKQKLRLAALETERENSFVSNYLIAKFFVPENPSAGPIWLGGSKKDGKWVWLGINKPLSYKNWAENQPSQDPGYECLQALPIGENKQIKWKAGYCEDKSGFPVCQSI